jgi:hypothetical protein
MGALNAWGSVEPQRQLDLLVVIGAPGNEEFGIAFQQAADKWMEGAKRSGKIARLIGPSNTNQLEEVEGMLGGLRESERELWIVLIGHGTFDGKEAKFNLAGPDLSVERTAQILGSIKRPLVLINCSSSSAPFINGISAPNRIVITATKSGYEENYSRFGIYLSEAIDGRDADIDKDGQVSLLEAFLTASRKVEEFNKSEKRLATEHAFLDDNGDKKGTAASFYKGVRPSKKAEGDEVIDGFRAHQIYFVPTGEEARLSPEMRNRRDALERKLEELRKQKQSLKEDEYLHLIEPVLLELGKLYQEADRQQ